MTRALLVLWALLSAFSAQAHEVRPAYLDIREIRQNEFLVLWKVPALGNRRLSLDVRMPETCVSKGEPTRILKDGAVIERQSLVCPNGLGNKHIDIQGLRATLTDVLARVETLDGGAQVHRVMPESPAFLVTGPQSAFDVASTYFRLGVDHILAGFDHLLFVLALFFLIRKPMMLFKTVTAFTVAHSVTLAGSTLGYFSLPPGPVEACIALSIAFVARELVKAEPGLPRMSETYPWIIAFVFGLLHGFGFAGALQEIGLPQTDLPLALLTFNIGVEFGQLLFLTAAYATYRAATALWELRLSLLRATAGYILGAVSTFWLLTRLASF